MEFVNNYLFTLLFFNLFDINFSGIVTLLFPFHVDFMLEVLPRDHASIRRFYVGVSHVCYVSYILSGLFFQEGLPVFIRLN